MLVLNMKKVLLILLILLPFFVSADVVDFNKCIDGDTFKVVLNDEIVTVRLLAVDTPESVHPNKEKEYYGEESSDFTCNTIKNAKKIEVEYDSNSEKHDKYNRLLVWVFVDGKLLQDEIIKKGYGKVAYLYDDYKYTSILEKEEKIAKNNKIGIWKNEETTLKDFIVNMNIWYKVLITVIIIFAICIYLYFDKKARRKFLKKGKKILKEKMK